MPVDHYLHAAKPRPGWAILDAARQRAFTGELVFRTEPAVRCYLEAGTVYTAEAVDAPSIGARLVEAGVLSPAQLHRGTVRSAGYEHLGRLFDRDGSIDRDAVMVVAELTTEELVSHVANLMVPSVEVVAYRHHPQGVRRWFTTTPSTARSAAPAAGGEERQARTDDRRADEQILLSSGRGDVAGDDLHIDWIEPAWSDDQPAVHAADDDSSNGDHEHAATVEGGDFQVSWPDSGVGDEHDAEPATGERVSAPAAHDGADLDLEDLDLSVFQSAQRSSDDDKRWNPPTGQVPVVKATSSEPRAADAKAADESAYVVRDFTGHLSFELPPLQLSKDETNGAATVAGQIPDDVLEAVRRAISAIESSTEQLPASTVSAVSPREEAVAVAVAVAEPVAVVSGQAPSGDERRSALERLIGSLRRS